MTLEHKTIGPQPANYQLWLPYGMSGREHIQPIADGEA